MKPSCCLNYPGVLKLCSWFLGIISFTSLHSQTLPDTVYYDDNFSICEKPVAEYYRVGKLKLTDTSLFYSGTVSDHYIDGTVLMNGTYDTLGHKNGHFSFYRPDGKRLKEGAYLNDTMKGTWSYYDLKGSLRSQWICTDNKEFTPFLIINPAGDTLLKNGNGTYTFNTLTDCWGVFNPESYYTMKGTVKDGKKDSTITYWIGLQRDEKAKPVYTEYYDNGKFIKNDLKWFTKDKKIEKVRVGFIDLATADQLQYVDKFKCSNMAFESDAQKLVKYLLFGKEPDIDVKAKSYRDDLSVAFYVFRSVLHKTIVPAFTNDKYSLSYKGLSTVLSEFTQRLSTGYTPREVHCVATLTIDSSGYFTNSSFTGNLTKKEIDQLNYYLSRISGLSPLRKGVAESNMSIKVFSLIDTLTDSYLQPMVNCRYMAYSNDSSETPVGTDNNFNDRIDFPAKYLGGDRAVDQFIQSKLSTYVPYSHGAPAGSYWVKVRFTIDEQGRLTDIKALNDPGFGMKEEAERVFRLMPDWVPARKNGVAVPYTIKKEVTFHIDRE